MTNCPRWPADGGLSQDGDRGRELVARADYAGCNFSFTIFFFCFLLLRFFFFFLFLAINKNMAIYGCNYVAIIETMTLLERYSAGRARTGCADPYGCAAAGTMGHGLKVRNSHSRQ